MRKLTSARETGVFAMLKGFMDESGIAISDKACAIAGFVGTEEECDRVAEEWGKVVAPIGVFHANEFFPRDDSGALIGRYRGLKVSDVESCVSDLVKLPSESKLEPLGMAIDVRAFMFLQEDERRWMTSASLYGKSWPSQGATKTPWFAPFHYCVTQANQYAPVDEKVSLTFDRQDEFAGNAVKIYGELKKLGGKWGERLGEEIVFSTKDSAVLLQAADLLAYLVNWAVTEQKIENKIALDALNKLAYGREYVRAMDTAAIDVHLRGCPFRSTFWQDMSNPDLFEHLRSKKQNVLAIKGAEGVYLTHHIKSNRVRVVQELNVERATASDNLNLTEAREDSTITNLDPSKKSLD